MPVISDPEGRLFRMNRVSQISFDNYTPAGDVAVVAICLVMVILLLTSYVSRTRSFRIFANILVSLVIAALVNIVYHALLSNYTPGFRLWIYITRVLYEAMLYGVFFLFALYSIEITGLERRQARFVSVLSTLLFIGVIAIDIIRTLAGTGFRLAEDGSVLRSTNVYLIGYGLFVILLAALLYRVHDRLFRRVMYGVYGTMAVSVLLRFGQFALGSSSLTTMTFVFPVIAMLYIFHSVPYNITLGSVDVHAMEDMVRQMHSRGADFVFLSLLIPEFDQEGKELPAEIRAVIRRFTADYFKGGFLFQIGNGHVVLMAPKRRNPDFEGRIQRILAAFREEYQHFQKPFKIVVGESIDEISRKNEYVSLIRSVERTMDENTVHRITPEDIDCFNREEYILRELTDICHRRDLEDPRVLAYCQPVFNLKTGRFDTAEALMRLRLEETGLVFPDQFIPIAESHGFIHILTEIILHKTCSAIRRLSDEGFAISRISVNVSVLELKDESFCGDISRIIESNRVPGEKLAIELTESNSEADFMIMQAKIQELRAKGLQFYLDDFGTGYSNMERIMELPFDIIKFDRSMVLASAEDERSEKIVENLAHMFADMEYSVLYEGVETDHDEQRCRGMSASYLQGYKYSRPIPIERLRDFLSKVG